MKNLFKRNYISYSLKVVIFLAALIGVIQSANLSCEAFMGGSTVFMYFTIQSNILIALVSIIGLILMILRKENNYIWRIIKLVSTVAITLTGVVFCFVLAPTMGLDAWNSSNVLTHVIVPVASIIDFFVVSYGIRYQKRDVLYVIIPPLLYAIYAAIGYVNNWQFGPNVNYPYFFLNWGSEAGAFGFSKDLPFIGVMYWIILLLLFLIGVGLLYVYFNNKLKRRYEYNIINR